MCVCDVGSLRYKVLHGGVEGGSRMSIPGCLLPLLFSEERVNVLWLHGQGECTGEATPELGWVSGVGEGEEGRETVD